MTQLNRAATAGNEPDVSRPIPFAVAGIRGEVSASLAEDDRDALVRALEPDSAQRSIHWGRNYLYLAELPAQGRKVPVVAKQFRQESWRRRLDRRWRGSKAERSWRVARALRRAGIATPEPLVWAESTSLDGPAYYACEAIEGATEARYPIRAINDGTAAERFPEWPAGELIHALADCACGFHQQGFWHRDYSAGNVLLRRPAPEEAPVCYLVDLNRCRKRRVVSLSRRMRDLSRMPFRRRPHQRQLLAAYFTSPVPLAARVLYRFYHWLFHGRHRLKRRTRALLDQLRGLLFGRPAYPHLPAPPDDASKRDRVVWDPLSDQPHQHASRWEKLTVRAQDLSAHVTAARVAATAMPRIWRAYRTLRRELYRRPTAFGGLGVCVRPWVPDPEAQIELLEELGLRHVLLRLHPWEEDARAEEELARELVERGFELAFSLPQQRELVRDLSRWRAAVERLAERFTPYGQRFVVGQAINRSKWGVWNLAEYQNLASTAAEILRRYEGVEVLGPGVIDFELHHLASVLNWPEPAVRFDGVASLLYVDRRGAPENTQLGFDTVGKVVLAHAMAVTGRHGVHRSWLTEVNWPLQEGPHAPAGRHVAVDEESAADFTVRYDLLALGTGLVERVYFWQLIARGYGLAVAEGESGLRRRPAFRALATLARRLEGACFDGPMAAPPGARLYPFRRADGTSVVVGWSPRGTREVALDRPPERVIERDGEERQWTGGRKVSLSPSPRYFELGRG